MYQNTKSSLDAADEYLEQAIKLDPSYGMAWSQLARILIEQGGQWLPGRDGGL